MILSDKIYTLDELSDLYDQAFDLLGDEINQDLRHYLATIYPHDVVEKAPTQLQRILKLFDLVKENVGQPILRIHRGDENVARISIGTIDSSELHFVVHENAFGMPYGRIQVFTGPQVSTSGIVIDGLFDFGLAYLSVGSTLNIEEATYLPPGALTGEPHGDSYALCHEDFEVHIGHDAINEFLVSHSEFEEVVSRLREVIRGSVMDANITKPPAALPGSFPDR